jgi:ubiquinone/menaquinone biosynthesis C-methylase UbiE
MSTKVHAVFEARNEQELAARYNDWAVSYDEDMGDHGGPREAVETLGRLVSRDARILDAGCGTGLAGLLLAEAGFGNIEGLDLSPGMLDEAAKKGCYAALHEQRLGETLQFGPGSFDAVLVVGVFVRAHAPSRSLNELVRITRPGGFVVFTLRPEFYSDTDFKTTMNNLAAAGRWRLKETSEPFDGRYKEFPGINLQVWAYEVLANE